MISNSTRVNRVVYKKLQNGKIIKTVEEQYLRKDIPCGLSNCPICDKNESNKIPNPPFIDCTIEMALSGQMQEKEESAIPDLFILDHEFLLNQRDFLENFEPLSKMIICDGLMKDINRRNIQAFHQIRNLIDMEQEERQIYYFYNENSEETYVE